MAHIRQSRPDSGLGYQTKVLKPFKVVLNSTGRVWPRLADSNDVEVAVAVLDDALAVRRRPPTVGARTGIYVYIYIYICVYIFIIIYK